MFLLPVNCNAAGVFITDIIDGDSLKGRLDGERVKTELRLWGIDSPEWNQPYGQDAKRYLRQKLLRKHLRLKSKGKDRYNRLLVILYDDLTGSRRSINEELVANGLSWVYKRYCNEAQCDQWQDSQEKAKKNGSGLWMSEKPLPPWQFKKKNK